MSTYFPKLLLKRVIKLSHYCFIKLHFIKVHLKENHMHFKYQKLLKQNMSLWKTILRFPLQAYSINIKHLPHITVLGTPVTKKWKRYLMIKQCQMWIKKHHSLKSLSWWTPNYLLTWQQLFGWHIGIPNSTCSKTELLTAVTTSITIPPLFKDDDLPEVLFSNKYHPHPLKNPEVILESPFFHTQIYLACFTFIIYPTCGHFSLPPPDVTMSWFCISSPRPPQWSPCVYPLLLLTIPNVAFRVILPHLCSAPSKGPPTHSE